MKVLLVHNHYQQPGGEDRVFAAEGKLLEERGHEVLRHEKHNDQVAELGAVALAAKTIWNAESYAEVRALIRRERPHIMHVHNTLPLLSPSIYHAARAEGVAVVQTLHNFRLLCPNALFLRDGHTCEACLGRRIPLPGIIHACYRGSRAATGAIAAMLAVHRGLGTWTRRVDAFIALTEFARSKFVEGGLPADAIAVKPNFVDPDPGCGDGNREYALYVGRLSPEKGLDTLLAAWRELDGSIPLKIVGDGPLAGQLAAELPDVRNVEWLGSLPADRVIEVMKAARVLVFPSRWYEAFPLVIAEALAVGLPVIASNMGSMTKLIEHGRTGLHFRPGDARDLASQVRWAFAHPDATSRLGVEARRTYLASYTADANYRMLLDIYETAIRRSRARGAGQ